MKLRRHILAMSLLFLTLRGLSISHTIAAYTQDEPPGDPIIVGDGILMVHTLPGAMVMLGCGDEQNSGNADAAGLYKTEYITGTVCVASNGYKAMVDVRDGKVAHAYMVTRIFLAYIKR